MKKHDVIRIGLMVIISSQISTAQKLIWEDNFDGETLCTNRWEHCPEVPRADNSYWCDDDAYLDGEGNLQVRIREDADGNIQCGAINSRDLFEPTYGYFEIRCKLPKAIGAWGAFWIMPHYGGIEDPGTHGTEVDIMESAQPQYGWINHALHWGKNYEKENHKKTEMHIKDVPGLYEGFHTYACLWTPDEYVFYVDGKETWRTSAGGVCQVSSYLKITAEAAEWAGHAQDADLPDYLIVDYVKVYNCLSEKLLKEQIISKRN